MNIRYPIYEGVYRILTSGRGCTELPDRKGEGTKTAGTDKGGHGTDHPGKPEPHRLPV